MAVQGDGLGRRGAPLAPPRRILLILFVRDGRGPRGRLRRPRVRRRERPHRAVPPPRRLRAIHLRGQEQVRPGPAAGRAQGRGKRGRTSSMRYISYNPPLRRRASLFLLPPPAVDLRPYARLGQLYKGSKRARERASVAIFHLSLRREVSTEQRTRGCVRLSVWRKFSLNCYGSPPSPFSHLILDPSLFHYLFPCEGRGKRAKSQFKTSAVRSLSSRSFVRSTVPALLFPPPPHLFLLIVLISLSPSFQGPFSVNESGGGAHTDPPSPSAPPPRPALPCLLEDGTYKIVSCMCLES